jgi:hypothetical protein
MTRFVRGVIPCRPEATPEHQLVNCSRKQPASLYSDEPILFTAGDLRARAA